MALTVALQSALGGALVCAAEAAPADTAELRRGFIAVGARVSDEPALRLERQSREASDAFMVGSSLAAWTNAATGLAYDATHPSGDGDNSALIEEDCYDEKTAFGHLQARSRALGLTPPAVIAAAGVKDDTVRAWAVRGASVPTWCR